MLNEASGVVPFLPAGLRFSTVLVSEFNTIGQPSQTFPVKQPDGTTAEVSSPDPGRALITGDVNDVNTFRVPSLWGVKRTAPYFHDNSAKSLEELVAHYSQVFVVFGPGPLTAQQQSDIVAYLRLL